MKNASLPSVRVETELRLKAESVLREGETLSAFMEQAVRDTIRSREIRLEFLKRGIVGRDEAKATGEYYEAGEVLGELSEMLTQIRAEKDR